jgi:hypothetical protein
MLAFAPNRVRVGPAGASEEEIAADFSDWTVASVQPDSGPVPSGPMREVPRFWYRLVRG